MDIIIAILVIWIVIFHINAFVLEAFLWEQPRTMAAFGTTPSTAAASKTLAINQGVYNLFLAAGLIWSFIADDPTDFHFRVFFLGCVVVAAITVGIVVSRRLMVLQGAPAVIALVLVVLFQ